jgi:DNA mismatch repair protein MutS
VIRRAKSHLSRLESEDQPVPEGPQQITFENPDPVGQELVHALLALNPDDLSPREAWLWVAEQRSRVERGEG